MNLLFYNSLIIGVFGGLLGAFYRNCLIPDNMIFNRIYSVLKLWVDNSREHRANFFTKVLGFVAYPLGYCIYCSSTWITIFLYLYLAEFDIWILSAMGTQHLVVVIYCKYLISNNDDLKSTKL